MNYLRVEIHKGIKDSRILHLRVNEKGCVPYVDILYTYQFLNDDYVISSIQYLEEGK